MLISILSPALDQRMTGWMQQNRSSPPEEFGNMVQCMLERLLSMGRLVCIAGTFMWGGGGGTRVARVGPPVTRRSSACRWRAWGVVAQVWSAVRLFW